MIKETFGTSDSSSRRELARSVEEIAREIAERSKDLAEHAGRRTVKDRDVMLAVKEWRSR